MSEEFIKRFKRFLKEEGVFKAFQQNFQPGYLVEQGSDSSSLNSFLETCSIKNAVSGAFCWGKSSQGFQFWAHIYRNWSSKTYDKEKV